MATERRFVRYNIIGNYYKKKFTQTVINNNLACNSNYLFSMLILKIKYNKMLKHIRLYHHKTHNVYIDNSYPVSKNKKMSSYQKTII